MLIYHEVMAHDPYDAQWLTRISLVLAGACRIWGISAQISHHAGAEAEFAITPAAGAPVLVRHQMPEGWAVVRQSGPQTSVPTSLHAGLPGLLRQLREDLAPDAPAGRLMIGAQPLLGPDVGAA